MTAYAFETITDEQALGFSVGDTLSISSGTASATTVLFVDGRISITVGAKTVLFTIAVGLAGSTGKVTFADGSQLYIGDTSSNQRDYGFQTPGTGAIYAGDGHDTMIGGAGTWLIQGNQGDDALQTGAGAASTVYGGQGNDVISFAPPVAGTPAARQFAQGNRGHDHIRGWSAADTLLGGQGNDTIIDVEGSNYINGNLGDDNLIGSGQVFGEGGFDTLSGSSVLASTLSGGDGDDRLTASVAIDGGVQSGAQNMLYGDDGNDTLRALSPQHDELFGGLGDDTLSTANGPASDLLDGGDGNDSISASADAPGATLRGGAGNDYIQVVAGGNTIDAGDGDDQVQLGAGQNTVSGGAGNDLINSADGSASQLSGDDGNDTLTGRGADTLDGGAGADLIDPGAGLDVMRGGSGADTFVFARGGTTHTAGQLDQILDWSIEDRIHVDGITRSALLYSEQAAFTLNTALYQTTTMAANAVVAIQVGPDVVLFTAFNTGGVGDALILVGRSLADISGDNFI